MLGFDSPTKHSRFAHKIHLIFYILRSLWLAQNLEILNTMCVTLVGLDVAVFVLPYRAVPSKF